MSVVKELGIPIKLIGVGEKITDLKDFSAQSFVDALLGTDPSKAQALKLKANKIFNIPAMDALVDSTAMKQQSSDTMTKPSDPKQRLKALFDSEKQQSQGAGSSSDEDGPSEAKKKRKPRPKPQALVQKQKQKQKNK